jgi:hypothetical protein
VFWSVARRSLPLVLLSVLGCGAIENRAAIRGRVTVDGEPLKRGIIRFIPAGDTEGAMAATEIVDGEYVLDAEQGPVVGELRVEILADESNQIPFDVMDPAAYQRHGGLPRPKQPLPPCYNTQSELSITLSSTDDHVQDFDLSIASPP